MSGDRFSSLMNAEFFEIRLMESSAYVNVMEIVSVYFWKYGGIGGGGTIRV